MPDNQTIDSLSPFIHEVLIGLVVLIVILAAAMVIMEVAQRKMEALGKRVGLRLRHRFASQCVDQATSSK